MSTETTQATPSPSTDATPEQVAKHLIMLRAKRLEAMERASMIEDSITASVKDIQEDIDRLRDAMAKRREEHEGMPRMVALLAAADRFGKEEAALTEMLKTDWRHPDKTITVEEGRVTRSTRRSLDVKDPQVAAKELLDRRLGAFIEGLKVNGKALLPLLEREEMPGLAATESYSVSVYVAGE